jgi:hypothetical protein
MLAALIFTLTPLPALLQEADQASERFIKCLFAHAGEARREGWSVERFQESLSRRCLTEEEALREVSRRIAKERNEPPQFYDSSISQLREGVVESFKTAR